jgi:hypothetical protein
MALHRTPTHHDMLHRVHDGNVKWRNSNGRAGGFLRKNGATVEAGDLLAALWELHTAGLIWIDPDRGAVHLSTRGHGVLSDWDRMQAGVW